MTTKTAKPTEEEFVFKCEQMTEQEHILNRADTYLGSIELIETPTWVYENGAIVEKPVCYIPGLYKLFDECLVNCRDHAVRMKTLIQAQASPNLLPVTNIDVAITEDGTFTFTNDGNGVDIAKHPDNPDMWIPEMYFAQLRTSTNFNNDEKKIVGGKNGFGIKIVFIWSVTGTVEIVDHVRGLKYIQTYTDNLSVIHPPVVTKSKSKPYTKISFKPDYARLGITALTPDMVAMFRRRVYDLAGITDKNIKIRFNAELLPIKTFQQYIDLYIGTKTQTERVYEEGNERWEYAVCVSPSNEFSQVSFVNGIYTSKGGKHVDYIIGQITKKCCDFIKDKKKIDVRPASIKEQLMIFLRCDIENPAFDSQTKDYLNSATKNFGSTCTVSDKFVEKICTTLGIMNTACRITEIKELKTAKQNDGSKKRTITGIPKLIDANYAGTKHSNDCYFILTEGDSAKAAVISGLSQADRNYIGIYPLKGKLVNVREKGITEIVKNNEIADIIKILGLKIGKKYTLDEMKTELRYGHVIVMTDQDLDGSHIKGLCINLFHELWETLVMIPDFIGYMNTPIIKATKPNAERLFYNQGEYDNWLLTPDAKHKWNIKYYKGLGTSTKAEFQQYFQNKKYVFFQYSDKSADAIDMAFNKKRIEDRKQWLMAYDRTLYVDTSRQHVNYEEFINNELIHFSIYDCDRNIPHIMDGLKISMRKIMFSSFKKNITSEIKVAQFSGYVSEHSCYHHGEASLNGTIIGLAQNFVGSNNLNLLDPCGQFGTRLRGGNDHSSERYIFTKLNNITRFVFNKHDDSILTHIYDDGQKIEPMFYAPIIPMVLVNPSSGIGTGYSSSMLPYNPLEIVKYLQAMIKNEPTNHLLPYFRGFKGTVESIPSQTHEKFLIKGCYQVIDDTTVRITEIPLTSNMWISDYLEFIDDAYDKHAWIREHLILPAKHTCTDCIIQIDVLFKSSEYLKQLLDTPSEHGCNMFEKQFKLFVVANTSNMTLFDTRNKLHQYANIYEIIDEYYGLRMELYQKRKDNLLNSFDEMRVLLENKSRYINLILCGEIDLRNKKHTEIVDLLTHHQLVPLGGIDSEPNFSYLLNMKMSMVSKENVNALLREYEMCCNEYETLQNKTPKQLWLEDLAELEEQLLSQDLLPSPTVTNPTETTKVKKVTKRATVAKK